MRLLDESVEGGHIWSDINLTDMQTSGQSDRSEIFEKGGNRDS